MNIRKSQHGVITVLGVEGALTEESLPKLDAGVKGCIESGAPRIVLELKETPFIDSAALERIRNMVIELGRLGGDLRVSDANEVCQDIFRCTRMGSFVQVFSSREEAIQSLL